MWIGIGMPGMLQAPYCIYLQWTFTIFCEIGDCCMPGAAKLQKDANKMWTGQIYGGAIRRIRYNTTSSHICSVERQPQRERHRTCTQLAQVLNLVTSSRCEQDHCEQDHIVPLYQGNLKQRESATSL